MAYEKIAAAAPEPALIAFYYTLDELFNVNSLWTMYKAVHKIDQSGENQVDELAITEDERDIFQSILSDAVYDVFSRFLKYTKGITNAIIFNEEYTPVAGVAALSAVVKVVDNAAYNDNYISPIDRVLEKTLRFYVLKEWFSLMDLDNDAAKAESSYRRNVNELLRHSMQLKKVALTV